MLRLFVPWGCLLLLTSLPAGASDVIVHPVDPSEGSAAPYTVYANGVRVPLERVGQTSPVYYARFSGPQTAAISVAVHSTGTLTAEVKPDRLVNGLVINSQSVEFLAEGIGPRLVFIKVNGSSLAKLFVIAEPVETDVPNPANPDVLNILDYGVTQDPVAQTTKIQQALNDCAALPSGGTVYVPPGKYYTGTLRIRNRTNLYLAGGAILQAISDPNAFPADQTETGTDGRTHSFSRLLMFDGASQSRLSGRGVLDGNGRVLRNTYNRPVQIIDATNSTNIQIEGVVLRNPASWTLHILYCDTVIVEDLKIITDWSVDNADGIDPDSTRNLTVERYFCYSGDDAIAVKATNNSGLLRSSYNITVRDSVILTRKTSLKIGTETRANISNVLFENIDCVQSSRGLAIWARDGGTISGITWRDIRMELVEMSGEDMSGEPFRFSIRPRDGYSTIQNARVENVTCRAPYYCPIESTASYKITGITFENVRMTVTPRTSKTDMHYLFEFTNASNIIFNNLTVDWTERSAHWNGLWASGAPVSATNVNEIWSKNVAPVIAEVAPDPDAGMVGVEYARALSLTQGYPLPTWTVTNGPAGLSVNSNGFVKGWTPLAAGTQSISVRATNSSGNDTESWQVSVSDLPEDVLDLDAFNGAVEGWTTQTWAAGSYDPAVVEWSGLLGHPGGHLRCSGSGATNGTDSCTREGVQLTKAFPTTDRYSISIQYDVQAALNVSPGTDCTGGCPSVVLEGSCADQLVVYYSTTGVGGPWIKAQQLVEGVDLSSDWTTQSIDLTGVSSAENNANFAVRFVWQFNTVADTGRIDNVRIMGTPSGGLLPGKASNPNPAHQAINVDRNADLSWTAGNRATSHDVYFGTINPPTFQVNQTGTTFDPGQMNRTQTYYWRIDERNDTGVTTGDVWQFTVQVAPGDFDSDGDVDLDDFGYLQRCYSGSGVAPATGCEAANLDGDNDVDQTDFDMLKTCFGGADRPPGC